MVELAYMMMPLRWQQRLAMDFYDTPKMVRTLGARCAKLNVGTVRALSAAVPKSFLWLAPAVLRRPGLQLLQ